MKPMVIAVGFPSVRVWAWFSESWLLSYCMSKTCFSFFTLTCCLLEPNITVTSVFFILPNVLLWCIFFNCCFEDLWPRKEVLERDLLRHFRVYMQTKWWLQWWWAARSFTCSLHCFHLTGSMCWGLAVTHPHSSPLQPFSYLLGSDEVLCCPLPIFRSLARGNEEKACTIWRCVAAPCR